jgi:hypothetical protein
MSGVTKFCKDCRHARPPEGRGEWMCGHPTVGVWRGIDVVTGEHRVEQIPCRTNRQIGNRNDAQHWSRRSFQASCDKLQKGRLTAPRLAFRPMAACSTWR